MSTRIFFVARTNCWSRLSMIANGWTLWTGIVYSWTWTVSFEVNSTLGVRLEFLSQVCHGTIFVPGSWLWENSLSLQRRQWQPTPVLLPGKSHGWREEPGRLQSMKSQKRLSDFTFSFHFHALEKEMATHSSILAWRIPGTEEPGGLPSMGSHRVGHDWSDLAAAATPPQHHPLGSH